MFKELKGPTGFPGEEIAQNIKSKFRELGVTTVAWDFDGTIIDTRKVFETAEAEATSILLFGKDFSLASEEERGKIEEARTGLFEKIMWDLRPEMGINPVIMEVSVRIMAKILSSNKTGQLSDDLVEAAVKRIQRIYESDCPDLFPGSVEAVSALDQGVNQSILVTHASQEWTWIKLRATGLLGKFKRIICLNINSPKSEQWETMLKREGIDPKSLLVIGDNREADIEKPVELGARGIWIDRNTRFSSYGVDTMNSQGQSIGERVIVVREIEEIVPRILEI